MSEHSIPRDLSDGHSPESMIFTDATQAMLNLYENDVRTTTDGVSSLQLRRLAIPSRPGSASVIQEIEIVRPPQDGDDRDESIKVKSTMDYNDGAYEETEYTVRDGVVMISGSEWNHEETEDGPIPTVERALSANEVRDFAKQLSESLPVGRNTPKSQLLNSLGRLVLKRKSL